MKILIMEKIGLVTIMFATSSLGSLIGTGLDDGCTSHWAVLPNSSKREITNVAVNGETFVSDASIVDGWYSVATGYVLTNTDANLHIGSCGTYYPIWINGTARSCNNGSSCSIVSGTPTGTNCTNDVDECETRPCRHHSTCINSYGSYRCQCTEGWSGKTCGSDVNECSFRPCQHNGTCINIYGSFACRCADGWTGETCEQDMNECQKEPCKNSGTCINTNGSYHCACQEGFAVADCSGDVDECKFIKCEHNGVCVNSYGSYQCLCSEGWTGRICETEKDEQQTGIDRTHVSYISWILFGVLFLVDLILIIIQICQCCRRPNARQSSKTDKSFEGDRYGQDIQNYEQHSSELARIDSESHHYQTLGEESTGDSSRRYVNQNAT